MHIQLTSATYEHLKGSHFIFERRGTITIKGNVEIETYWLKGKRDKDGNAQAACPQFETQTISKINISSPEGSGDKQVLGSLPVAGRDENDVKSIRSHRIKMDNSGHRLKDKMEECQVEEMSVHKDDHQETHLQLHSPESDGRDSILNTPDSSCDSKSATCSVS
ncbi:hypothetical protein EYF80_024984 [Liparis tanakae]|uniref:Guanylate cyclase domain-containing protein n=1 Tax=Liparis tanakae TaxID=230148 RepID=A0A4Z2HG00_9TELE|nr:hypothetical protein EYF80_024984 [Liparis tanakae]